MEQLDLRDQKVIPEQLVQLERQELQELKVQKVILELRDLRVQSVHRAQLELMPVLTHGGHLYAGRKVYLVVLLMRRCRHGIYRNQILQLVILTLVEVELLLLAMDSI
jgi:hypothetical protein